MDKQNIAIWGFGKEGRAVLQHLQQSGEDQYVTILSDVSEKTDYPCLVGEEALSALADGLFHVVYKSPGISLYTHELEAARAKGTILSDATNLWFESQKGHSKAIVITGTKGKSTTSSLLFHIMKTMGLSVSLAGNIGTPPLNLTQETDYTILELSSYQLATLKYPPDLFCILNLFPEHLEWHKTHDAYYEDKLKPIRMTNQFPIVANQSNPLLAKHLAPLSKPQAKTITWFSKEDCPETISSPLKGMHNRENIAAIYKIIDCLGLSNHAVQDALNSFKPLPHRLQEFSIGSTGAIGVNDSISTTPETALSALQIYKDQPLYLFFGGTEREQDYKNLVKEIKSLPHVQHVFCLPETGERLFKALHPDIDCTLIPDLKTGIQTLSNNLQAGDVVLLSPAAPSYGQFKNFEERGHLFIKLLADTC